MPKAKPLTPAQIERLKDRVIKLNEGVQRLSDEKSAHVVPEMLRMVKACDRILKILEQS